MGRLDILKQENNGIVQESVYKSNFDFKKFKIEDESIKQEISLKEEEIINITKKIKRDSFELAKELYNMQKKLSSYRGGTFVAWFSYMGMDKNTVYRAINRYKMFLSYRNPQIAHVSVRTIEFLKKNEENLTAEEVNKVLEEPERTSEVIKQIKNRIIKKDIETKETIEDKLAKLNYKKEKLKEEIIRIEEKIVLLEKQLKNSEGIEEAEIVLEKHYIAEDKKIF